MLKRIFDVLYVSVMGLTRCYKTTVFLHLYILTKENSSYSINETWVKDVYRVKGAVAHCGRSLRFMIALLYLLLV